MEQALTYPENLDQDEFWNCNLADYRAQLRDRSDALFGDAHSAQLDVLQFKRASGAYAGSFTNALILLIS